MKSPKLALPLLHRHNRLLNLLDRALLIQFNPQPFKQPNPMQKGQIRVGQLISPVMTVVPILHQPTFLGCDEQGEGFSVEHGGRIGDGFVDGGFGDEAVVVEVEVNVEGDGFQGGGFFGCGAEPAKLLGQVVLKCGGCVLKTKGFVSYAAAQYVLTV